MGRDQVWLYALGDHVLHYGLGPLLRQDEVRGDAFLDDPWADRRVVGVAVDVDLRRLMRRENGGDFGNTLLGVRRHLPFARREQQIVVDRDSDRILHARDLHVLGADFRAHLLVKLLILLFQLGILLLRLFVFLLRYTARERQRQRRGSPDRHRQLVHQTHSFF